MTLSLIRLTAKGEMANARRWPQVMHGPYHSLAAVDDFPYVFQREKALVYPSEMNHVSLLKLRQLRDVKACVGHVKIKKMVTLEMQMIIHAPTFPQETKTLEESAF